ncbi:immunity 53 family protein [Apibacter mensalis]|uniref:immunity 53 family protein n=1 Tax=Apibacter mensalis TaxID=1586267 RepID=UPI0026EB6977|nr:immunity 53 family protein [Apibacter mensalis]
MEKDMLVWLEEWYASQCDGYWEHNYGVKIETFDNPGWGLKIELEDTGINIDDKSWVKIEISETEWLGYKIENGIFDAFGGAHKLNLLIKIFKLLVDNGDIDEMKVREYLQDSKPDIFI